MDSVIAAYNPHYANHLAQQAKAVAAQPPFIPEPEVGSIWFCTEHPCSGEGRYVVGIVVNRNQEDPGRPARRAARS